MKEIMKGDYMVPRHPVQRACSLYSFTRSFKKDGYIKKEGGEREREMEVGAIQSRRLRGKNEIHSSGERDPGARW